MDNEENGEDDQFFDMYPNDGAYFQPEEPSEQKMERNLEKSKVKAALPLIDDLLARFKSRIMFYDSIEAISDDTKLSPEKFLIEVNSNKQTKEALIAEYEWVENLKDSYK